MLQVKALTSPARQRFVTLSERKEGRSRIPGWVSIIVTLGAAAVHGRGVMGEGRCMPLVPDSSRASGAVVLVCERDVGAVPPNEMPGWPGKGAVTCRCFRVFRVDDMISHEAGQGLRGTRSPASSPNSANTCDRTPAPRWKSQPSSSENRMAHSMNLAKRTTVASKRCEAFAPARVVPAARAPLARSAVVAAAAPREAAQSQAVQRGSVVSRVAAQEASSSTTTKVRGTRETPWRDAWRHYRGGRIAPAPRFSCRISDMKHPWLLSPPSQSQQFYALVASAEFFFNDVQNESIAEQLRERVRFFKVRASTPLQRPIGACEQPEGVHSVPSPRQPTWPASWLA